MCCLTFWRLQVQGQGVGRVGFFQGWEGNLSQASFCSGSRSHVPWFIDVHFLCPPVVFPLCVSVSVSKPPFSQGHQSQGIGAHCHHVPLHLTWACCCLITKPYLTLSNPMDCNPPGSSVHGISQARILECVAISFSRGSSQPRDWTRVSCIAGRLFTIWATREDLQTIPK